MVYGKTEYRRTFRKLSSTSRQQIYDENIKYREKRKLSEFNHQPFAWNGYKSDSCSDSSEESSDIPLPKNKSKHKELVEKWLKSQNSLKKNAYLDVSEVGIQTPKWDKQVNILQDQSTQVNFLSVDGADMPNLSAINDVPTNTLPVLTSSPCASSQVRRYNTRKKLSRISHDKMEVETCKRMKKTSQRNQPPFHSYGWADETKSMADKKSYNIFAGKDQVHQGAIKARKKKQNQNKAASEVKTNITSSASMSRQSNTSAVFDNKSSRNLWQSEYQRCFSRVPKQS